jgi:hypothetical protein
MEAQEGFKIYLVWVRDPVMILAGFELLSLNSEPKVLTNIPQL